MAYKYKISVIIPVYKVEEYLSKTIESVIGQTIGFKENIQIILVNDGSPDNSESICLRYKKQYPDNIVYHKKENGGVSSARNAGIPFVEGKYVNFLDSDDLWSENAFEEVFCFFEEHYDEIDVLSSRIRFFDGKDKWHPLDYKYTKGSRVVDINKQENVQMVQSTVATTFVKTESIGGHRFNESVKFGEDSLFINTLIMNKCKYGLMKESVYYYRKRADESSAVQGQTLNKSFYLDSIEKFHSGLQKISEEKFGEVIPYIQAVVAYDLQYRAINDDYKQVLTREEQEQYFKTYREVLSRIEDAIILGVRVQGSYFRLLALLEDKNGRKFEEDLILHEDGRLFYRDLEYCSLKNNKKNFCRISGLKVENGILKIEMLLAKFILDRFGENAKVVFRVEEQDFSSTYIEYEEELKQTREGDVVYYYKVDAQIPVKDLWDGKNTIEIRPVLCGDKFCTTISMNYAVYIPTANFFQPVWSFFDNWFVRGCRTVIKVRNVEKKVLQTEKDKVLCACNQYLNDKNHKELAALRTKYVEWNQKTHWKKIWLFSDGAIQANGSGERLFQYVCKHKPWGVRPIFVISKDSKDVNRIKSIGETIFIEDKEYLFYFLCAEKVISSSLESHVTNPFASERGYIADLQTNKFYYLKNGVSEMEYGAKLILLCKKDKSAEKEENTFDYSDNKNCRNILKTIK